jgi:hypothetical protein
LLDLPARVAQVEVTSVARSPFARSVAIDGEQVLDPQATRTVALGPSGKDIPILVVAEDGTEATYPLEIRRRSLAADATLSTLDTNAGTLEPAVDPGHSCQPSRLRADGRQNLNFLPATGVLAAPTSQGTSIDSYVLDRDTN